MSLRVFVCSLLLVTCIGAQTPAPATPQTPPVQAPAPQVDTPAATKAPVKQGPDAYDPPWDSTASLELFYWLPRMKPILRAGRSITAYGDIDFTTKSNGIPGVLFSIPVKRNDVLRATYWQTFSTSGTSTVTQDTTQFGSTFVKGDKLTSKYRIQAVKASFESIFWPYPKEGKKLRFKTLWEVQYVNFRTNLDSTGVDSSGNATTNSAKGSNFVILPTLGMAMSYSASKAVHFDVRASGFMIPHRSNIGDTEASMSVKLGPLDLVLGGKYYHFRTSPNKDQWVSNSMPGGYVGLRYYFK